MIASYTRLITSRVHAHVHTWNIGVLTDSHIACDNMGTNKSDVLVNVISPRELENKYNGAPQTFSAMPMPEIICL